MRGRSQPTTAPAETRTFALREDGGARIAVVADSHSRPHPRTAEHLRARSPDLIIHAGDIGDLAVLDGLAEIAPTFAVRGNIDEHVSDVPESLIIELTRGSRLALRLFLTHIAVYGPKLRADFFVYRLQYENYDGADQFTRTETNAGLRLGSTLGPKTTLEGSLIYTHTDPTNTETWIGRLDLDYNFTDTLLGRFSYQHWESTSSIFDLNYSENLFFVSLTKYFQ